MRFSTTTMIGNGMKQKPFNAKNRKEKGRRIADKDTTDIPPEQQPPIVLVIIRTPPPLVAQDFPVRH